MTGGGEVEESAEPTDAAGDTRAFRASDVWLDPIDSRFTSLDVNPGFLVTAHGNFTGVLVETTVRSLDVRPTL